LTSEINQTDITYQHRVEQTDCTCWHPVSMHSQTADATCKSLGSKDMMASTGPTMQNNRIKLS